MQESWSDQQGAIVCPQLLTCPCDGAVPARTVTSNLRGPLLLFFSSHKSPQITSHFDSCQSRTGLLSESAARQKMSREASRLHNWLWIEAEDSGGGGVSDWWRPALFRSVSCHSTPNKQWQTWIKQMLVSLIILYFNDFPLSSTVISGCQSQDNSTWLIQEQCLMFILNIIPWPIFTNIHRRRNHTPVTAGPAPSWR